MSLGTKVRLARLFSHPSGNLFGGAVDHFVGYGDVRKGGLADLPGALARVMVANPTTSASSLAPRAICGRNTRARLPW